MAKVSGAYESVVRGVSEKVPQDRLSGQHWEQVNMVPDPVRGLSRRHGSVTVAETLLPNDFADLLANTATHRAHAFSIEGHDYDLLYRTGNRPVASAEDDTLFCFDRTDKVFLPVSIHDTAVTTALRTGGVSAVTQVGRFILMGGNTYNTAWASTERFATTANKARLAVWIRGGGYARTFKVTLTDTAGAKTEISYKTKTSSYPNLLDTSDLLTSDPDYQKNVNDRVNEYNGKVTAWIGEAAEDITPENIAAKLAAEYDLLGYGTATVSGSTILIDHTHWAEVSVDDGGDGSLAEGVGNSIESVEDLCPVHYVGKVVKVQPSKESPDASFFVQAYAKDEATTGYGEVTWKESAGVENTPTTLFVMAAIHDGTLYVSDSAAWLETALGPSPEDVPVYKGSRVGDAVTNPLPNFMGQKIDFLAVFQDRLVVGSGPVITMSRRGDYFNFFRRSVLTILDDDPVEEFALGSEEDVIKHATPFNRDLILYGQRGQYAISGKAPITPQTAGLVAIVSKYESAIDAVPKVSGNLAFYAAKRGPEEQRVTSLQQIQPAALSENPDSQDVSQQLDQYLQGTAIELLTLTKPNTVILRTDAQRTGLYLYNYLDRVSSGERVVDAWHRWEWSEIVGHLVGVSVSVEGDLLAYVAREDEDTGQAWLACERFSLTGALSAYPHLDAQRDQAAPGSLADKNPESLAKAYPEGPDAFEGMTLAELGRRSDPPDMTGSRLGVLFDSYVEPTNPFPRDNIGRSITFGRLTLGTVRITLADTGGLVVTSDRYGTINTILDFNGFRVGSPASLIGDQPVVSATLSAYVGGEVRECRYTIKSKRWLPLTITALEWAGQIFNRERRA